MVQRAFDCLIASPPCLLEATFISKMCLTVPAAMRSQLTEPKFSLSTVQILVAIVKIAKMAASLHLDANWCFCSSFVSHWTWHKLKAKWIRQLGHRFSLSSFGAAAEAALLAQWLWAPPKSILFPVALLQIDWNGSHEQQIVWMNKWTRSCCCCCSCYCKWLT